MSKFIHGFLFLGLKALFGCLAALAVCACESKDEAPVNVVGDPYEFWVATINSALDDGDTILAQKALKNAKEYAENERQNNVLYAYNVVVAKSEHYQVENFVTAISAGVFSEKVNGEERYCDYALVARLFEAQANLCEEIGDHVNYDRYIKLAAETAEQGNVTNSYVRLKRRVLRLYEDIGSYDVSINGYQALLPVCRQNSMYEAESDILYRLSMSYLRMGDVSTAQIYVDEMESVSGYSIIEDCKYWVASATISSSAADTVMLERSVEALRYLRRQSEEVRNRMAVLIGIVEANYYMTLGYPDSARIVINETFPALRNKAANKISGSYVDLLDARIRVAEGNMDDARGLIESINPDDLRRKDIELYELFLSVAGDYYSATGNYKEAYHYTRLKAELLDSLRFEVKGSNLAFRTLESRRDTVIVSQVKMIMKAEDAMERAVMLQSLWIFGCILLVVLAIFVYYYLSFRRIKKRNDEIEAKRATLAKEVSLRKDQLLDQQKQLESKNRSLRSELIFAKHIQSNIFSPQSILDSKGVDEHFVFFRPCYQVSGDFYWFHDCGDKLFVCAADATGHGIPGAFISMVASTLLADIVANAVNPTPSFLLEELSKSLSNVLRNNSEVVVNADSVDMTMFCIDRVNKRFTISLARHVAYIVRVDGTAELIQGTKRCVGEVIEVEDGRPFEDIEVSLAPGDCIYLASDGYVSQFGGPNNKKFKRKRFEDLLASFHTLPASEQLKLIELHFDEWEGKVDQTDDVLVIGLRIGNLG